MVDTHEAASKLLSKSSRWKAKLFTHDDASVKAAKQSPTQDFKLDDDVNAFLKPSTDRAQQHKENAAAAFLATARPRIDVARAQRWPAAQDVVSASAGGRSPGPGGLKTVGRKKGLVVSFVRTVPEIIGHGGDECEEPAAEVARRKLANAVPGARAPPQLQDDVNLGTRSNNINRTASQTEQRNGLIRTSTSYGELSPPLGRRLEMGQINTHAQPPPSPLQHVGSMGLGDRPKPLERAPTGFDGQVLTSARRPSDASAYSQDSDNASPLNARKTAAVGPTIQEEADFVPKPLKRAQTSYHEQMSNSQPPSAMPAVPQLPQLQYQLDDDSPLDAKAMIAEQFLQSNPADENSFAARVKQRMGLEEGRALQDTALRHTISHDSDESSVRSGEAFRPDTSPIFDTGRQIPARRRTPPQHPPVARSSQSPTKNLEAGDPQRSRARLPSPARKGLPSGTHPIDINARPSSSNSSQLALSPTAPQFRASPRLRSDPFASNTMPPTHASSPQDQMPLTMNPQQYHPSQPLQPRQSPAIPLHIHADPPPPIPARGPGPITQGIPPNCQPASSTRQDRSPNVLARSDTRSLGEVAYKEFGDRVTHMRSIFQLTAQLRGQIFDQSLMQWLRVCTWWFLRGRAGMEALIRNRPREDDAQPERLSQAHVDLAKVLWILSDILPNHPQLPKFGHSGPDTQADLARQAGDVASAEAYELFGAILHYLKLLVGSMKKHSSMPPTQALIQGQDQSIWVEYPSFDPHTASVLGPSIAAVHTRSLADSIPVTDSKSHFCYFRMFAKASLSTDDPNTDRVPFTVVISVLRPKDGFQVKLSICSQNELVDLVVDSDSNQGLSWQNVSWKKQSQQISLQLRHGYVLNMELSESEWRSLWAIVDHTNRIGSSLNERGDEHFVSEVRLRQVSYKDSTNPSAFPPDWVPGCQLRVFEKVGVSNEGTGKRKLHRGYRLVLSTTPNNKQINFVSHEVGSKQEPMNFEYLSEPDQAPGMKLHFVENAADKPRNCLLHLVFEDGKDRNNLFGTLTSMNLADGETTFAQVPLKAFSIESADQAEGFSQQSSRVLEKLQWQDAKVINQDPEAAGLESAPTVLSESLRIVCRHSAGMISDRMNLGPGDLLVRLPIDGAAELTLLRNPQLDLTIANDGGRTERDVPEALSELLHKLTNASTIRRLTFNSFKDLHAFQLAVTGFDVKYDGIASTFSISRRRMVVPIYKQWMASTIRLQIVSQDNIPQLLAFFEDFSHADAMNFQLRTTDVFEKTDKSGKFGVRLVDAKFALPVEERRGEGKMQKEEGRLTGWAGIKRRFVCLDEIEYPGEHDDILIMFDSAQERDLFAAALPAVTVARKFTVRRKI